MPTYVYRGLQGHAERMGEVESRDYRAAITSVRRLGILPLEVRERRDLAAEAAEGRRRRGGVFSYSGSVSGHEVTWVTRQLATLTQAGFPLVRAIGFVKRQAQKDSLYELLDEVEQDLRAGVAFSDALAKDPKHFNNLYISMIRAGEVGGILDTLLERLAGMREADESLRSKIKGAMTYPALMLFAMIGALLILFTFVVPQFAGMFEEMGKTLPAPTQMLLDIGHFFQEYWWLAIGGVFGPVLGLYYWGKTDYGRVTLDLWKIRLPLVGGMINQVAMARFCRTLGTLLESGVNLIVALEGSKGVAGNEVIADAINVSMKDIREGKKIGQTFASTGMFPDMVCEMMTLGEESGQLGPMLLKVADIYERQTDQLVKGITSILEPLMILLMGVIVGMVVVAMLLPIFEMNVIGG